jgi:hypothetical protein
MALVSPEPTGVLVLGADAGPGTLSARPARRLSLARVGELDVVALHTRAVHGQVGGLRRVAGRRDRVLAAVQAPRTWRPEDSSTSVLVTPCAAISTGSAIGRYPAAVTARVSRPGNQLGEAEDAVRIGQSGGQHIAAYVGRDHHGAGDGLLAFGRRDRADQAAGAREQDAYETGPTSTTTVDACGW